MSEEKKLTRQEIYQRIRETSKDEYILSEMVRLGFWPDNSEKPSLSEAFIKKRAELQAALRELGRQQMLYSDPEDALKEMHKQRKKAALAKREETRRKRNEERFQRAQHWREVQAQQITYLGENVSGGLGDAASDDARLRSQNLPVINAAEELATAMGVTLNELRFLAYNKEVSKLSHYQQFAIAKKTGGVREISAPMPRMKRAQYWILDNILAPLSLHEAAHGFVVERSIVSNAQPHVGKDVVINLDLKDFFPTVSYARIKGAFRHLGYSEQIATILGLLCSQQKVQEVEMDGQKWFVSEGERFLPQGAPTSPAISNVICRKLDRRLQSMAAKLGFTYTRYADDVTFSADGKSDDDVKRLLWRCRSIIKDEGFVVHPDKTRIMRKHRRQEVTGVVVNDKASVERKQLKRFRALLFQIDRDGPAGKTWGRGELFAVIDGFANYVAMVNPEKGVPLQQKVAQLKLKYGVKVKPSRVLALNKKRMRLKAAKGEAPREDWWQAQAAAAPEREKTAEQVKEERKAEKAAQKAQATPVPSSVDAEPAQAPAPTRPQQQAQPPAPGPEGESHAKTGWIMLAIGILIYLVMKMLA
ncbi:reverse transcriptase family protein [Hahella sp. HN01]|uniref:reverse transcriptase family protein n=1 Tax=Hahella sp. HN01 TaxID=2847262 RepID=UPI001C1F0BA4|nr:reverse transcriptase family protein [Hahella sp. HN01]MBU6953227.1 reverse transcriptase family protein [Hahella sp. HN01]